MKKEDRKQGILKRLQESDRPVSASVLSSEFGVSRQIIVKDIASLREEGFLVQAQVRGYVLEKSNRPGKVFKVIHTDEEVEKELNLIVDNGGTVEDVFIYHKIYNKVEAKLNIRSRMDVKNFLENIASGKSGLLMHATSGYHYHTVLADSFETLARIEDKLWEEGFLAKLQAYEPDGLKG